MADEKKPNPRKQNFTAYLGTPDKRARRTERLKLLAELYADGKASVLIQKIADGDLIIFNPKTKQPA